MKRPEHWPNYGELMSTVQNANGIGEAEKALHEAKAQHQSGVLDKKHLYSLREAFNARFWP